MAKETDFTVKIDSDLQEEFIQEADAAQYPVDRVVRELMQAYVAERQDARAYREFLTRKVERARISKRAGAGRSNEEVEAEFAAWRNQVLNKQP